MALKGYLASGFQKLIGASRLQGANTQWVGEANRQIATISGSQFSNTLYFGDNIIEYTGSSNINNGPNQIFTANPTTATRVTILNNGTGYIRFSAGGSTAGAGTFPVDILIQPNQSFSMFYDLGTSRWRQAAPNVVDLGTSSITVLNAATSITTLLSVRQQIAYITPGTALAVANITTITKPFAFYNDPCTVTLIGSNCQTSAITLVQDTTGSLSNGLILNGDFTFTTNSSITLVCDGTKWIETARTVLSYP